VGVLSLSVSTKQCNLLNGGFGDEVVGHSFFELLLAHFLEVRVFAAYTSFYNGPAHNNCSVCDATHQRRSASSSSSVCMPFFFSHPSLNLPTSYMMLAKKKLAYADMQVMQHNSHTCSCNSSLRFLYGES